MKLSAVIFDLDGTVVADEDEYGEAFARVLKKLGVIVDSEYPHVGGIGVRENWPIFIKKYNIKTDKTIEELTLLTQQEYKKLIPKVTLKDGFIEFVTALRESEILVALATSNTWDIVENIFDYLHIEKYFDSVTTGEEVSFKKPEPDIFLVALDKMGIEPERCLVFEDSESGIEAAKGAGMKVIGIYRDNKHLKTLNNADLLKDSFDKISLEEISNL
ncbi:hypothetical protein A2715_02100 [Candidatus Woesebacteria bacterium RIFCSPHIGHO2_01_FULL_39_32]|uniref:HAD-superfamily hydrolase, subfamily IA, variant 3 n=2 Tax=Candidatus Woeseibacteriota TaxID=1752722 RepID=A0A0G0Q081_9BACT|nr:MAG: HAD-superfamily hydrolase, subfamily IA, variant 3 [Candidatus Woesebacteria bacterium GW2011_GWA1_39_8]OGM03450.1 MAG: hypothetical protein A2124_02335 [Candidatus Woesebacteria bacterium GWB1_37_5]OGM23947.1 MAG: hypothetical protein A2715_02100 [Candidatus Woesebacteria bacterium RIFCSPHIGHO2_01_FULL_39_32]OGM37453.1 MAG: hypothetical protein A3F01_03335 [Candidatus Woesebacteria bacterium RIFCSPHIGHO2_12_FULL_38_11]OGM64136.1 MAG: hypothetical protein A2893_03340 [Candidatus Woeseba